VIFDLVYNHAGGGFDPASIYFFDRQQNNSNNDSLYFTDKGWAGGLIFAYWKDEVRQFLIDNAKFCLEEYHIDGIRYDEVSVIDDHGGWHFAQDLTGTVRFEEPQAIQIAEYWKNWRWLAVHRPDAGLGFDAALGDGLRDALRAAINQASYGMDAPIDLDRVAASLYRPYKFPAAWQAVQCIENHDIVYNDRPEHEFRPRVAALADKSDARSWYARSRSRAAMALVMTAPGIPMTFTGQEFLEYRNWSDNPEFSKNTLTQWDRLKNDSVASNFLRFARDVIALRLGLPALRDEAVNVFHVHNQNRVLAFHRWIEGAGEDVVVVMSLNDSTFWSYDLGFPGGGRWREVFNSDYYDHYPNPWVAGNGGGIDAFGAGMHRLPASATIVIPANSVLVFAR
jgi:1,4-alpha-glucan branching enzyme